MQKTATSFSFICAAALSLMLTAAPTATPAQDYEAPPTLDAKDILDAAQLSGERYSIDPSVLTDGFMARVTIESDFGAFVASGPGMVDTRLDEIRALAVLQNMQEDERFKEAATDTAQDTVDNIKTLVQRPRETLQGVPEGVGRFFNRTSRSIKTGVQKLGDVTHGRTPGVDPSGASNMPGGASAPETGPKTTIAERLARASGDVAVNVLGFDKQRRRLAKELGVDPYSTNKALSDKLDEVTWAAFAGGLGVNVVTSLIPGGMILSTSSRLTDWVWDTSPGDLRVAIEEKLLEMGVPGTDIDRLLRHNYYPLSMQAVLVGSLEDLDGVNGRAAVLPLALSAKSEGQAMFVVQTLDMLRSYHQTAEPLSGLIVQGTVTGRTQTGNVVAMGPIDYLCWTASLDTFVSNQMQGGQDEYSLHIAGLATERAKRELSDRGWVLEENSSFAPSAYPIR